MNINWEVRIFRSNKLDIFNIYFPEHYEYFFSQSKIKPFSIKYERIKNEIYISLILYNKTINKFLLLPVSAFIRLEDPSLNVPYYLEDYFSYYEKLLKKLLRRTFNSFLDKKIDLYFFEVPEDLKWIKNMISILGRYYLCLNDFATGIHHLKRYWKTVEFIDEKDIVLEFGHGMGYFVNVLSYKNQYYCYDIDPNARLLLRYIDIFDRANIIENPDSVKRKFDKIISLEVLEHVHDFINTFHDILDKLKKEGSFIFSLPEEEYGGSHLNYDHITNWNFLRVKNFISNYFNDFKIYKQRVFDFFKEDFFDNSDFFSDAKNIEYDEIESYLVVGKNVKDKIPHKNFIHIKRTIAMGDTLLAEPIIRQLKIKNPDSILVMHTKFTEIFKHNPFIDILVVNHNYGNFDFIKPTEKDTIIDLDFAYEKQPELSILNAYQKKAQIYIPPINIKPQLFLTKKPYQKVLSILRDIEFSEKYMLFLNIGRKIDRDRTIPIDIIREILVYLKSKGINYIFLLGTPDNYSYEDIKKDLRGLDIPQIIDLTGKLTLSEVAAFLSIGDLLIAPDTGLVHLAGVADIKVLAFFGLALPEKRIDYNPNAFGILSKVDCVGCLHKSINNIDPHCVIGFMDYPVCLKEMNVEEIRRKIAAILDLSTPYSWEEKIKFLG